MKTLNDLKLEADIELTDVTARDIRKVIDHLHAQGRIVPDGYVAVPVEPTEKMIEAAHNAARDMPWCMQIYAHEYKAMIAAAPKPPAQEGE